MQDDRSESEAAFEVGKLHANDTIYRALSVGNAGGVRVALDGSERVRRIALFTSLAAPRQLLENPYADRIEGDVLTCTGRGKDPGQRRPTGGRCRLVHAWERTEAAGQGNCIQFKQYGRPRP